MKIVHIHFPNDLYGASRSLLRISSALVNNGHSVIVIMPPKGPLQPELEKEGVKVHLSEDLAVIERSLRTPAGLAHLVRTTTLSIVRLAMLLRREKVDVVHSNTSTVLSGALAARLAGIPHVWHLRENYTEFKLMWAIYRPLMLALSTRIICISDAVTNQFGRSCPRKIARIYNGIDFESITPLSELGVKKARSRYGLEAKTVFGVVGRIRLFRKGQEVFVEAAKHIYNEHSEAAFVVIGSAYPGNEEHVEKLHKLAKPLGEQFLHLEEMSNLSVIYSLIDVLVLPSCVPEPFGNVIMEAMTQSLPVIASNGGGASEQVVHEKTGLLTKIGDSQELAQAMKSLLSSRQTRRAFGNAGRQRVEHKFAIERTLQETLGVLTSAATA